MNCRECCMNCFLLNTTGSGIIKIDVNKRILNNFIVTAFCNSQRICFNSLFDLASGLMHLCGVNKIYSSPVNKILLRAQNHSNGKVEVCRRVCGLVAVHSNIDICGIGSLIYLKSFSPSIKQRIWITVNKTL